MLHWAPGSLAIQWSPERHTVHRSQFMLAAYGGSVANRRSHQLAPLISQNAVMAI